MKKFGFQISVIAAIASVGILSSCGHLRCVHGSGNIITENRKANNFTKLDISDAFKVHLTQDSSLTISIKGDDNELKYVSTSVEGNTLHIKSKKNFCDGDSIVINIGIKKIDEIDASGAVVISSNGKINTGDLSLGLSGATKLNLDINAGNVDTQNSGVAEMNLKGQAASHKIQTSGMSKLNAFDFVVGDYDIDISGVGNCKINVLKTLSVHSSGAAEVEYKGSPATVNNDKSGASKITKVD
ncbi:head GIN domain-containing protein [Mucilaginibacter flavus]|uniref:head GIN domain-containing protein n=1 Tax=Mucilaginibacter flavus TaxID=931504 RepID=UPI0025B3D828|nr:head GIN domain-containing protein [Mucilaginibacter flavus]MDN3580004.1 head GIN domain-containing protein [Mucilaginibacter flavus]